MVGRTAVSGPRPSVCEFELRRTVSCAIWIMRGLPNAVTRPKVLLVMLDVGLFQLAWFRMLKKSERNSSFKRSFRENRRLTAMSH